MYRYKRSVKLSPERQMYVYSVSRLFRELPEQNRNKIKTLCDKCGGEYSAALFEFVTTDITATALYFKYHISKATLYRCMKKYYEGFPQKL